MKFMKIDTDLSTTAAKTHNTDTTDDGGGSGSGGYMYLDEMLDKTFITDYFLQ
jgi:hypothetical protein